MFKVHCTSKYFPCTYQMPAKNFKQQIELIPHLAAEA